MDDKKEILTILDKIINNFSIDNLVRLFQNKTTKFRMLQSRASQPLFTDGLLLGEFDCGDESVCIFTFKTHQPLTERSGKKAQYELAKKMLKEQIRYDGGFFIFYDEQGNFRFSLIYDIPLSSGTREWSNFKRYTYYVGKEQTNKTFIQQMAEANFSSLNSIIKAFSVKKLPVNSTTILPTGISGHCKRCSFQRMRSSNPMEETLLLFVLLPASFLYGL